MLAISVDGIHCRIWEPRTLPSSGWYSKKFNGAGLSYEVGVAIWHNQIVWINGPFPCGQNDGMIFGRKLKKKMNDSGIRGIADRGYTGHTNELAIRNAFDGKDVRDFKKRAAARQETVNARLKAFGILSQAFRGRGADRMEKHRSAFEACAVIVQYEMENGKGLFNV